MVSEEGEEREDHGGNNFSATYRHGQWIENTSLVKSWVCGNELLVRSMWHNERGLGEHRVRYCTSVYIWCGLGMKADDVRLITLEGT